MKFGSLPEIWIPYGQVEVSFEIKQENLSENCRARNSHQDLEGGFAESSRFPNMRHASNPFRNPGNRGAPKHNTRKVQGDQASPPHQSNSVPCEEKECRALNQV